MRVLVVGSHGKIGQRTVPLLVEGGHRVRALVRRESQAPVLEGLGATAVVGDVEQDVSDAMRGCEAVVFTAGSGAHTGPEKTLDVDRDGAIRVIDTARALGTGRFLMVSSRGADRPERGRPGIRHYLEAKAAADRHLQASGLAFTILRPGRLVDEPGTGHIRVGDELGRGSIPRDDVARTLAAALAMPETEGLTCEILSGDLPIEAALAALARDGRAQA